MPRSLHAAFLKVERAEKHFAELQEALQRFADSDPYVFVVERHEQSGGLSWVLRRCENLNDLVTPILGDLIHNLRASLDVAMFEILKRAAKPGAKIEDSRVAFPVAWFGDAEALQKQIVRTQAEHAPTAVLDLIRELKPYSGSGSPIVLLAVLNNIDKHRGIVPPLTMTNLPNVFERSSMSSWENSVLSDPQLGYEFGPFSPDSGLQIGQEHRPAFQIAMPGVTPRQHLVPFLHRLINYTWNVLEALRDAAGLD